MLGSSRVESIHTEGGRQQDYHRESNPACVHLV